MPDLHHLTLGQIAAGILTFGALVALIGGWLKWLRPKYQNSRDTVTRAIATLAGQEEIRDKATDEVIRNAIPGMGVRMASMEATAGTLVEAVAKLAENIDRQQRLHARVDHIEERVEKLENAQVERVVAHAHSTQELRLLEAAINANPPAPGEAADEDTDEE